MNYIYGEYLQKGKLDSFSTEEILSYLDTLTSKQDLLFLSYLMEGEKNQFLHRETADRRLKYLTQIRHKLENKSLNKIKYSLKDFQIEGESA